FQGDYRAWRVGDWQPLWTIGRSRLYEGPGPVACARDGRLAAIALSPDVVRLVDVTTGRTVAALEGPDPKVIYGLCFAPDGPRLAVAPGGRAVQGWALRAVRRDLATMRLDWDLPPLPPPRAGAGGPAVVRVEVEGGE